MATHNQPTPRPQFLRVRQVAEMLGVSINTAWRWAKAGIMPAPIKIGPNATVWALDELLQFIAKRGAAVQP